MWAVDSESRWTVSKVSVPILCSRNLPLRRPSWCVLSARLQGQSPKASRWHLWSELGRLWRLSLHKATLVFKRLKEVESFSLSRIQLNNQMWRREESKQSSVFTRLCFPDTHVLEALVHRTLGNYKHHLTCCFIYWLFSTGFLVMFAPQDCELM